MKWAYGITTVPSRRAGVFERTLCSLEHAGFCSPRLFVDCQYEECVQYRQYNLDVSYRCPPLRTAGNWVLSLYELYLRQPDADRYAVFQDDLVTYRNLRGYLEKCPYPDGGYLNLYTFPHNQSLAPSQDYVGWYPSNQFGRGAVALAFSNEAVRVLLSARHMVDARADPKRRHISIDGSVIDSFKKAGWKEYVHMPSLVQHTGEQTSMDWSDMERPHPKHRPCRAFHLLGEDFDALELLGEIACGKS